MSIRSGSLRVLFALWALAIAQGASAASFQTIPGPDGTSSAYAISADATTVVGTNSFQKGAIWHESDGWTPLLPVSPPRSAWDLSVSADGSVVVGRTNLFALGSSQQAFRWSDGTGATALGSAAFSHAEGVSADGSVIVGGAGAFIQDETPFLWTAATGMTPLPLAPGDDFGWAAAVSGDGSRVVGTSYSDADPLAAQAFLWTAGGTSIRLGVFDPSEPIAFSFGTGISADGSVAIGYGSVSGLGEAFRWTELGGMEGLGHLGGGVNSQAYATSADGSVIVGEDLLSGIGTRAFLWTASGGMRDLAQELATQYGIDLGGFVLLEATGVSADGRTIVGNGRTAEGAAQAWIATIPEPSTALLAGAGLLWLGRRRRL